MGWRKDHCESVRDDRLQHPKTREAEIEPTSNR